MLKQRDKNETHSRASSGDTNSSAGKLATNENRYNRWFWQWFIYGEHMGSPGYTYYLGAGLTVDAMLGVAMMYLSPVSLAEAARTFLLPVAGIMIGLTFAWVANANAVLHTPEIEGVTRRLRGGLTGVIWEFQLAALFLLTILMLWCIASLRVFDVTWPTPDRRLWYMLIEIVLYGSASFALRICWRVVRDVQNLFVTRHRIREDHREACGE